ncbi:MAG: hypothetical protein DHS80DRAFT_32187 [Piptocephalis tieghemiana]|nr:MAG: hypothetical protein DHS80DRAFT_32187 [Piptocephalis tieghemiana]
MPLTIPLTKGYRPVGGKEGDVPLRPSHPGVDSTEPIDPIDPMDPVDVTGNTGDELLDEEAHDDVEVDRDVEHVVKEDEDEEDDDEDDENEERRPSRSSRFSTIASSLARRSSASVDPSEAVSSIPFPRIPSSVLRPIPSSSSGNCSIDLNDNPSSPPSSSSSPPSSSSSSSLSPSSFSSSPVSFPSPAVSRRRLGIEELVRVKDRRALPPLPWDSKAPKPRPARETRRVNPGGPDADVPSVEAFKDTSVELDGGV